MMGSNHSKGGHQDHGRIDASDVNGLKVDTEYLKKQMDGSNRSKGGQQDHGRIDASDVNGSIQHVGPPLIQQSKWKQRQQQQLARQKWNGKEE